MLIEKLVLQAVVHYPPRRVGDSSARAEKLVAVAKRAYRLEQGRPRILARLLPDFLVVMAPSREVLTWDLDPLVIDR